jgi:DNA-binding Lrp family transcriptional regulator
LTGEADYLVKLVVPDLETLSRLINEVFLPHRSVGRVRSSVVLDRVKETARLPLRSSSQSDRKADTRLSGTSSRRARNRS